MRAALVSVSLSVALAAAALAGGRHEALATARWLVDLARDHGLNCRGEQTTADVQHVHTLLRAAARLNPQLADAHLWLHELAALREQRREATDAIRRLLEADPTNATAFARWLAFSLEGQPTAEKRAAWLEQQLVGAAAPPQWPALIHVELARLALARLDRTEAQAQLDRALALDPTCPAAARLALEALADTAPVELRLRTALRYLALNPLRVETAWQVGRLLDQYGFVQDADTFQRHALEVFRRDNPGAPVPAVYLLELARHEAARGQWAAAAQHATDAAAAEPALAAEAGLLLHWLLTRQGQAVAATDVREQLSRRFAQLREPDDWPLNEVAQAAWFYCTLDPQPQRALLLAQAAAQRAPQDPFVLRLLGWAQAANLLPEAAERTLLPIAGRDAYAAYLLARLRQEGGDEATARRIISELEPPPTGHARELIDGLGLSGAATQPAEQRYPALAAALADFNRAVLDFHRQPSRSLEAAVAIDDRSPAPGEPWWAEFTLTNRAGFPITLGADWMVNPVFLLSFEMEGDGRRSFPHLLTVHLDRVPVLLPGQTVSVRQTIDLGPLRRALRLTPQHMQRVVIRTILDPTRGADHEWRPSVGGQNLAAVHLNRLPAGTTREAVRALFAALAGDAPGARFRAVEVMAALLGESQRAARGRLSYRPEPIPAARFQQALVAALGSESWELRARTLDALQVAGLDAQLLQAAEDCLRHPHWLVRLMAVRLLGSRQGAAGAARMQRLADQDADELVRALAASYVAQWQTAARTPATSTLPAAASQPADSPTPPQRDSSQP